MAAKLTTFLFALLMTYPLTAPAQTTTAAAAVEPIRYTLSFPAPHTHYIEVSAQLPTGGRPQVELMMPVWTPGSYLVREYERNVEAVSAVGRGDAPLTITKPKKNHWRITTGGAPSVTVRYRVYSREMSVRTNW